MAYSHPSSKDMTILSNMNNFHQKIKKKKVHVVASTRTWSGHTEYNI